MRFESYLNIVKLYNHNSVTSTINLKCLKSERRRNSTSNRQMFEQAWNNRTVLCRSTESYAKECSLHNRNQRGSTSDDSSVLDFEDFYVCWRLKKWDTLRENSNQPRLFPRTRLTSANHLPSQQHLRFPTLNLPFHPQRLQNATQTRDRSRG